jgi:hypothetical protein
METISHKPQYRDKFSDKRLDKRAEQISSLLMHSRVSSIKGITKNESEQKAFYRFLENEKVEEKILIEELKERCSILSSGRDVIVLQDTTEIGLSKHANRLIPDSGVGLAGNKKGLGFMLHTSLVLDANRSTALGFSDIQLWHRREHKANNTTKNYKKLTIGEKESYRWIKASEESKKILSEAKSITIIEDREGAIYEQFASIPDITTHLLIRSRDNRKLWDGSRLYDTLSQAPLAGTYTIKIIEDLRKEVVGRMAKIEVRFCKINIRKPATLNNKALPEQIELYAVEAAEITKGIKNPIKWRILTTHPVNNYDQALGIIGKYRMRWYIEQLFRLLKKKGFKIEESELSTGWAIRKLTVMLLNTVLRIMQLLLAYGNEQSQPIEEVFVKEEIKFLMVLNQKLQGVNKKTKNNNLPKKLSWATWIIARMGGWKGYASQRPPGPITLKRGLEKFTAMFEGWSLANPLEKDVSTR